MKQFKDTQRVGEFCIEGNYLPGDLKLNGSETTLELHSKSELQGTLERHGDIHGVLGGNEKVSLLDCITRNYSSNYSGVSDERRFSAFIFPHYAVFGPLHINRSETKITALNFVIQDATELFYDFGAFGTILNNDLDIKSTLEQVSKQKNRDFELGDHPELFYYSGKRNIFEMLSDLGTISAYHAPTITFPSPEGISVINQIPVRIKFEDPHCFDDALNKYHILLPFLETLIGRPQNIMSLDLEIEGSDRPQYLSVYSTMREEYKNGSRDPHCSSMLLNGGMAPQKFSNTLKLWLLRHNVWHDSRARFIQSFRQQNHYTIDRLIGAANMFDIMPTDAAGTPEKPSDEIVSAIENAKEIIKKAPPCQERDRALGDLGRVGKHNLKSKVKNRAKIITSELDGFFPDLDTLIDEAINCRNFFVHGTSQGKLSSEDRYTFLSYFTDMLEFIFATSDLVECGWDIKEWATNSSTLSHPFRTFLHGYGEFRSKFHAAIEKSDTVSAVAEV
jgi:hypothetical protein